MSDCDRSSSKKVSQAMEEILLPNPILISRESILHINKSREVLPISSWFNLLISMLVTSSKPTYLMFVCLPVHEARVLPRVPCGDFTVVGPHVKRTVSRILHARKVHLATAL